MSLSHQWWQSSSALNLVSTAATLLGFAGGIWAALYASRPRRALTYSCRMQRPTTHERANWVDNIMPEIQEQVRAAKVNLVVRGSGRLDVPTSVFDNGTPITVNVAAAPIRSEVGIASFRGGGLQPDSHINGNEIAIGPGLIGRNQILVYTWITVPSQLPSRWGRTVHVTVKSALVDTKLRPTRRNIWISLGVVAGVTALIIGLWYGWLGLASHLSSGQAHISLSKLASKTDVLIALLPLLLAASQLSKRHLESRPAAQDASEKGEAKQAAAKQQGENH